MKLSCQIVQDLLPLYVDGACSGDSRAAVEEHLAACEDCMREAEAMRASVALPPAEEETVRRMTGKKAFRRVRRRVIALVLAVLLMIPLGTLSIHQALGEGVCFTNIAAIVQARSLLNSLKNGDYETAVEAMEPKVEYDTILTHSSYYGVAREYVTVEVEGASYYVDEELARTLDTGSELSAADFWLAVIRSGDSYLLPQSAYELLQTAYPEALSQAALEQDFGAVWCEQGLFYYPRAGFEYDVHANIPVGSRMMEDFFYVAQGSAVLSQELYGYVQRGTAQEEAWYQRVAEYYQGLGYEGYAAAWRRQAAERLEALEQAGQGLTDFRLSELYRYGGGWLMRWTCDLQDGSQEDIQLMIEDGTLSCSSGSVYDGGLSGAFSRYLDSQP